MTDLTDEQIEEAFAQFRVKFEKRNNATGLEMLDGLEDQWAVTGGLSERQRDWVERQFNGTWRATGSNRTAEVMSNREDAPTSDADLIDVIIERRLSAEGKAPVDAKALDRLKRLVGDLNDVLRDVSV